MVDNRKGLFFDSELQTLDYTVETDSFQATVPILKEVTFTNIIGKLNPNADKYITLACHYDSKYFGRRLFQGATDSAVHCSIMLNLIKTLKPVLDQYKERTDISLMVC